MRPSAGLFALLKALFMNAWDQKLAQANELRKAIRRDILKTEKQIDGFLEKIGEAASGTVIKAYERKIDQLEKDKLVASKKLENSFKPKTTSTQMLELCMKFLSNPCKLWDSGDSVLQKTGA